MTDKELWRSWPNWSFEVSNQGRVVTETSNREIKPELVNRALWVWIPDPKHRSDYKLIRLDSLVAQAFIDEEVGDKTVKHIDNDPFNCSADNLEISG